MKSTTIFSTVVPSSFSININDYISPDAIASTPVCIMSVAAWALENLSASGVVGISTTYRDVVGVDRINEITIPLNDPDSFRSVGPILVIRESPVAQFTTNFTLVSSDIGISQLVYRIDLIHLGV